MKEKAQAFFMWIMAVPVTAKGVEALARGATTLFGALTALLGFLMGVYGLIWWRRRLRRQKVKMELEELQLRIWRGSRKHPKSRGRPSDEE